MIYYTDPATGGQVALDAVQTELYNELVTSFGVHPDNAATVAFLMDAEDPARRVIDWSKLFVGTARGAKLLDIARPWLTTMSKDRTKPEFWASIEEPMGGSQTYRMWTIGRLKWLAGRD